jgi:hypothetical protein
MTTPDEIRSRLKQVTVIDDHASILEEAVNALEDLNEPALLDEVLGVFERCGGQDDYGLFSSLQHWIERLPDTPAVRASVQASLLRHPTWKVIEMIGSFTDSGPQAAALLEQVQREGTFTDPRYQAAWLQKRITELKSS